MSRRSTSPVTFGRKAYLVSSALVVLVLLAAVAIISDERHDFKAMWGHMEYFLKQHPVWAVVFAMIAPGLPIPASIAFAILGVAWAADPRLACFFGMCALLVNFTWTYALSRIKGKVFVERLLSRWGKQLPRLESGKDIPVVVIIRLTPGLPLFLQNYCLGVLGVPFGKYLFLSMLISGPIAMGIILGGAGLAEARWGLLTYGLVIVACGYLSICFFRFRRRRKNVDI